MQTQLGSFPCVPVSADDGYVRGLSGVIYSIPFVFWVDRTTESGDYVFAKELYSEVTSFLRGKDLRSTILFWETFVDAALAGDDPVKCVARSREAVFRAQFIWVEADKICADLHLVCERLERYKQDLANANAAAKRYRNQKKRAKQVARRRAGRMVVPVPVPEFELPEVVVGRDSFSVTPRRDRISEVPNKRHAERRERRKSARKEAYEAHVLRARCEAQRAMILARQKAQHQAYYHDVHLPKLAAQKASKIGSGIARLKRTVRAVVHRLFRNVFQSAKDSQKRDAREAHQKRVAQEKKEAARKAEPKRDRADRIRSQRDKRHPVFQSGKVAPAAIAGACAFLFYKVSRLLSKGDRVMDKADDLFSILLRVKDEFVRHFGKALWYLPLVGVILFLIHHFKIKEAVVLALIVASLSRVLGPRLWNVVADFFRADDNCFQSGLDKGFIEVLSKLLSTGFVFSVLKSTKASCVSEFCKRLCMLPRMVDGWETFLDWLCDAITCCVNTARKLFGKESIELFKNAHKPAHEWAKRVDRVVLEDALGENITAERLDELVELARLGSGFRELYRGTDMSKYIDQYLVKITNALLPYQGTLNSRNNFRFEPACMMLYGGPGIGKTLMAMPFCAAVMLESGLISPPFTYSDVIKQIWQKGNSEYWNGYSGQLCMVMDDAFQQRVDQTDKENEFMTLIRMIGSWSFPLNFADLASKGKIYFSSKFVFGTTNMSCLDAEARIAIHEPEAVTRRMNFPYRIRVKKEFSIGDKLDYPKFEAECLKCLENERPLERFPWYIWEAAKHDFLTGVTSNAYFPMTEVLERVATDLRKRSKSFKTAEDRLRAFADGYNVFQSGKGESSSGPSSVRFQIDRILSAKTKWEVLGVAEGTPHVECIAAHRRLMLMVHPDKVGDSVDLSRATAAAQCLNEAVLWTANWHRAKMQEAMREHLMWVKRMGAIVASVLGFAVGYVLSKVTIAIFKSVANMLWSFVLKLFGLGKRKEDISVDGAADSVQSNRPTGKGKLAVNHPVFQAGDVNVINNVYANSYKVFVQTVSGEHLPFGQVQFIESNLAVMPAHFTRHIQEMVTEGTTMPSLNVVFRNVLKAEHALIYTVKHFLEFKRFEPEPEVEFFELPGARAHRNVTCSFVKDSDLKSLSGYKARLDVSVMEADSTTVKSNARGVYFIPSVAVRGKLQVEGLTFTKHAVYEVGTVKGDCGAPLALIDNAPFSGRTCFGFHIGGNVGRNRGYGVIITQELIGKAKEHFVTIHDAFTEDLVTRAEVEFQAGYLSLFENTPSFLPLGTVSKPVHLCPKTSFRPTQYYGVFGECDLFPAHLSPVVKGQELIYPMENAVRPYSTPVRIYNQPWLRQALHVAMQPFFKATRDIPREIYDFDTAVMGLPEQKLRSIPRATACGYPYCYKYRDGKKAFFGSGDVYELVSAPALELRERVEYMDEQARRGVRLSNIFMDFLKDELRPSEKNDKVATRLISCAPLDYTIEWRRYFSSFTSAVMRTYVDNGMAPGINSYVDFGYLAEKLQIHGDRCFDGDFKGFDSSLQPIIFELILEKVNEWYDDGPENALVRRVLWEDLLHSRHIGGLGNDQRHVYQWNKSLPSGHPFTTVVNSIYSLFCLVSAYIVATGDLTGFWAWAHAVTYGDDNVVNVSEAKSDLFNQVTVSRILFEEFGMVYTSGDKSGFVEEFTTLDRLTFLKRSFRFENGMCYGPLQLDSFLYTFYWTKNLKEKEKIINDNLEDALVELSLHDDRTWDYWAPRVHDIMLERNLVTRAPFCKSGYLKLAQSRKDAWF